MSFSPVHPAHLAYVRSSYAAPNDFSIPSHSAVAHTDNGTDTDTDTDTNTNTDTGTGRGRGRGTDTGTGTDTRKFSKNQDDSCWAPVQFKPESSSQTKLGVPTTARRTPAKAGSQRTFLDHRYFFSPSFRARIYTAL